MNAQAATEFPLISWPSGEALPRFSIRSDAGMLMETSITAGLEALRRRGLEVGGLLLGSSSPDELIVDALEPVISAYPEGPSYRVPEQDLAAALAESGDREIAGFYRSRTDGKLELDEQDRLLLRLLARNDPVAILLVRQTKQTAAEARLGFGIDGTVVWAKGIMPLSAWLAGTIDRADLATAPDTDTPASDGVPAVVSAVTTNPARAALHGAERAQSTPPQPFPRHWRGVLMAGGVAAAFFLMTLMLRDKAGDDRSRSAAAGHAPDSRVPDSRVNEPAKPVYTAPVAPMTSPVAAMAVPGRTAPPASPRVVAHAPPRTSGRSHEVTTARPLPQPRADRPRQGVDTGRAHVRETGSPPVVAVPAILPGASMTLPQALPAPPPQHLQRIVPQSGSPQVFTAPSVGIPPSTAVAPVQFVPPVLSRQSSPVIVPPDLRRVIQHEVVLSLRVAVDEAGNVTSITPVNRLDRTEQALARSYSAAIQTWQFDPAKRNGVPARGETILNFRIIPSAERQ